MPAGSSAAFFNRPGLGFQQSWIFYSAKPGAQNGYFHRTETPRTAREGGFGKPRPNLDGPTRTGQRVGNSLWSGAPCDIRRRSSDCASTDSERSVCANRPSISAEVAIGVDWIMIVRNAQVDVHKRRRPSSSQRKSGHSVSCLSGAVIVRGANSGIARCLIRVDNFARHHDSKFA